MKTATSHSLIITLLELVAARFPNDLLVQRLIDAGAPIKYKTQKPLCRDTETEDVEFLGTIFRCSAANGDVQYFWNQTPDHTRKEPNAKRNNEIGRGNRSADR